MLKWKDKKLSELDRKKIARNSGTYMILLLALVAMTFFGVCSPRGSNIAGLSGYAAKVAGQEINSFEFRRAYQNMMQRFQSQFSENFDPASIGLAKMVLRQLIDERIMYLAALSAGVEAQTSDVEKFLLEAKAFRDDKGQFSEDAYNRYLKSMGYTEASFTEELRRSITVQRFRALFGADSYVSSKTVGLDYQVQESKIDVEYLKLEPLMAKVVVTDDDIKKFLDDAGKAKVKEYYESHAPEFNQEAQVKARHILVQFNGSRNASAEAAKRTKEQAKARAEEIAKKVSAPNADFAKTAKEMTDEPSGKTSGGDLGYFNKATMDPKFSEAAFALAKGKISGVVETPFGFHIIKVEDRKEPKNTTLEAATNSIAATLIKKTKAPEELRTKADLILADLKAGKDGKATMSGLGVEWKSTGPVSLGTRYFSGLGSDDAVINAALALHKVGEVAPQVYTVGDQKFILRLKARSNPESLDKLTADKRADLSQSASSTMGSQLLSAYEKSLRKNLEEKGKVWQNPKYVELDVKRSNRPEADADTGT